MDKKNGHFKTEIKKKSTDVIPFVEKKIDFFKDVIQKTIIHVKKNKNLDILGISDMNACNEKLCELSKKIDDLTENKKNQDVLINNLQQINNELSTILKGYGTDSLEDLLQICFGNNKFVSQDTDREKFVLLKKYFHPTSYKVINIKEKNANYNDQSKHLSCFDAFSSSTHFNLKVYGIELFIHNSNINKSLIITGIIDDVIIDVLNNNYITNKKNKLIDNFPQNEEFELDTFKNLLNSFSLKDYLVYETEDDIYSKYAGLISQFKGLREKNTSTLVKEFINDDMFNKRNTLIQLLIRSSNYENQYLAYLLYDLLSNESNGSVDTQEQTAILDSFPWTIKKFFKQAIKKTIQYTNELSNFDINKIPIEQQICLLKASDVVKEKAMVKLKEVKAKTEDTGSKARQYLDGLLKIPFNDYKREPILNKMGSVRGDFKELYRNNNIDKIVSGIPSKEKYTSVEVLKYIKKIQNEIVIYSKSEKIEKIKECLLIGDKNTLMSNNKFFDSLLKKSNKKRTKFSHLNKEGLIERSISIFDCFIEDENESLVDEVIKEYEPLLNKGYNNIEINNKIQKINKNMTEINDYMSGVKKTLDGAVYGHDKAKKQIERIIGQWINGEQDGYCFGFEGPPGVGKTSLAKRGLSDCLKDDKGVSRPFAMIQMGGDSNGSTLHGHNYTYVGSTWGSIVQILIEKKCMNPIIFIDEVDKISRTENGKEIVGILTHLLDPAQNDCFQDKYFTGIDLDLSKALFILSYNDVNAIDKILLDRVHRIKFDSLSIEDKLVICKTHILPEIYKKMGLEDIIIFEDEVLKYIIDEYTCESGVRKLKEILFEIVAEINLDVLKNNKDYDFPIVISVDDIKNKFFKDKRVNVTRKVPSESLIGYANGMYATSIGNGGTLPIHAKFFPSEHFLELKLTGLQQDVMRESMHVSLTVAWNLTSNDMKKKIRKLYDGDNNKCGINIHPGDGSVQKDGPSAGGIITVVLYSLLNELPIKAHFAMTGEIQMTGDITEIGGLNHKILGSLKAGVKEFIYPKENKKEFDEFYNKYKDDERIEGIKFYAVQHISEALDLMIDK